MKSGISVTITRERLVALRACALDLFDTVAPSGVLHIAEWTQLHDAWLSLSEHAGWLVEHRLVPRADLTDAYLRAADLCGAYMRVAVLCDADLRGADLRGADLRAADLTGADLTGADLTGAVRGKSDAEVTGWAVVDGRMVRVASS